MNEVAAIQALREACDGIDPDLLRWDRIIITQSNSAAAARSPAGGLDWMYRGHMKWSVLVAFIESGQGSSMSVEISASSLEGAIAQALVIIEKRREDVERNRT